MSYVVRNGKIQSRSCELNVAYHCNLSCRACSHLSPKMKKHFVDPAKVLEDFSVLAKYYQPEQITLLGGEPLLHPSLLEVIAAVRKSGISDRIRVITNGILLWRMSDLFWQSVDVIHVSVYPGYEMSAEKLALCKQHAREHNVDLRTYHFDRFHESYSELGTADSSLVRRIYSTCSMAHTWHCNTVDDGYFYKCPLSLFIPKVLGHDSKQDLWKDGIQITESQDFGNELLNYLLSTEPLKSCSYCLGTVGKSFPHTQEPRHVPQTPRTTEELVDWEYLSVIELDPTAEEQWQDIKRFQQE